MKFASMKTFSNLDTDNEDQDDNSAAEWQDVFDRLDPKDGVTDGRIDKEAFLNWMDTLDFFEPRKFSNCNNHCLMVINLLFGMRLA